MPTYEYACRSCGHHLEVVQSFSDDPLTDCPACAESALRKVFSPIGITFKGSGFYKTDSRSSSKKKETAATSGSKDSTKDSSTAKDSGSTKKDSAGTKGTSSTGETKSTKSAKSA